MQFELFLISLFTLVKTFVLPLFAGIALIVLLWCITRILTMILNGKKQLKADKTNVYMFWSLGVFTIAASGLFITGLSHPTMVSVVNGDSQRAFMIDWDGGGGSGGGDWGIDFDWGFDGWSDISAEPAYDYDTYDYDSNFDSPSTDIEPPQDSGPDEQQEDGTQPSTDTDNESDAPNTINISHKDVSGTLSVIEGEAGEIKMAIEADGKTVIIESLPSGNDEVVVKMTDTSDGRTVYMRVSTNFLGMQSTIITNESGEVLHNSASFIDFGPALEVLGETSPDDDDITFEEGSFPSE